VIRARSAALPAVLLLVTLIGALLAGCTAADGKPSAGPSASAGSMQADLPPCPDQPATHASGKNLLPALAFDCLGGGTLDLGRAPGVPTVVNLWASWCGPCREELPLMEQLASSAGSRVRVVGVISKDGRPQANSFAAEAGVTFPGAFDGEGRLMAGMGIKGLPYTYFLDASGAVAYTQVGPVSSLDELRSLVAEHLGVTL
jgi:thiol-disulfide isomerase/thioredoxin